MITQVVVNELERNFLGIHQIEENLWTLGDCARHYEPCLSLSVAPAPGGGYSHFGRLAIGDFEVVCTLKTVWGIISHRHVMMDHHFEFCDPAFPDNLIDFVKLAAHNAQRCFELAHNRMWNRHRREHRY